MQLLKHAVNPISYLYEIKAVLPPYVVVIVSGGVRHYCVGFKVPSHQQGIHGKSCIYVIHLGLGFI